MKISSYRDNKIECNNWKGSHVGITKDGITKIIVNEDNTKSFRITIQPEDIEDLKRLIAQYEEAVAAGRLKQ